MARALLLLVTIATVGCGGQPTLDITDVVLTREADDHVTADVSAVCHTYSGEDGSCPLNGTGPCVRMSAFPASETAPCQSSVRFDNVEFCSPTPVKGDATASFTLTSTMVIPSGYVIAVVAEERGESCEVRNAP